MARRPNDRRRLEALLATQEAAIRDAFFAAIRNARAAINYGELVRAVEAGDWMRATELLRIDRTFLYPLEEAIRAATIASAMTVTSPRLVAAGFSFTGRHLRAERILAEIGARLVTEIGSPGPEAIRAVLLSGQERGIGAQKIARELAGTINPKTGIREGGIMGLDGPRAIRAARVREILSDPAKISDYFKREDGRTVPRFKSTDRRFDSMVRRAIAKGEALPAADAERIARAHEARLLKARGDTIARNEAYTAQAMGRNEAYRQLAERPDVEAVVKRWQHATLKNPRHDHKAMDGKTIPIDEAFVMDDGTRMQFPHDPAGGPEHSIGCRCSVVYIPKFRKPN